MRGRSLLLVLIPVFLFFVFLNNSEARYYDPQTGRFLSEDPAGFDGGDVNLYSYVKNNPINAIDPSGLWGIGIIGGGTAEAGVAQGGAYQYSSGTGFFVSDSRIRVGGFTSEGGFAGESKSNQFVAGATAGLGAGLYWTNAKNAQQLLGPFDTTTLNLEVLSIGV